MAPATSGITVSVQQEEAKKGSDSSASIFSNRRFFLLPPNRLPSLLASTEVNTGMQEEITGIGFTQYSFPESGVTK